MEKSFDQLTRASDLLVLNNLIQEVPIKSHVQNIVATVDILSNIDIKTLSKYIPRVTYKPTRFPGAILRTDRGPVCLVFATGKVVIVGSTSEGQLLETFNHTYNILKQFLI